MWPARIGGDPGEYFGGRLGELLIYPRALPDADRQEVEGYLAWKWGAQDSLPADHPWKDTNPNADAPPPPPPTKLLFDTAAERPVAVVNTLMVPVAAATALAAPVTISTIIEPVMP